jgi:hypothetical protein
MGKQSATSIKAEQRIVVASDLEVWLNSGDSFLVELANACIGEPPMEEEQAVLNLTFLLTASMVCSKLGLMFNDPQLMELNKVYNRRSDLFKLGLVKMGYHPGRYMYYVGMRKVPGTLERVTLKSTSQAEYNVLGPMKVLR